MLSLRSLTSFVALPSPINPSPYSRRPSVRCRLTEAAAAFEVVSGESDRAIASSLTELQNGGGWKVEPEQLPPPTAEDGGEGEAEKEEERISSVHVPREKYINVSKSDLVNAVVTTLLDSQDGDADIFLLLATCLDSILHAEHKKVLEQMRADFVATQSLEKTDSDDETNKTEPGSVVNGYEGLSFPLADGFDIWNFLISTGKQAKRRSAESVTAATRFQRSFIQLLDSAGFEELSARDLALTSALNTDYLLTLPVYVDWNKASESNAIVFRRGYATEKQKGLLLVEKLDYIQSVVLRGIFSTISKPLRKVGKLINKALSEASQTQEIQDLSERVKIWLKELSLFKESYLDLAQTSDKFLEGDSLSDSVLPMRLAAKRAVSRYEGLLTPVGPRERLFRKLLTWIGFISPGYETPFQLANDSNASEPYLRPISLSRMTLGDIWKPASKKACGNDMWKRIKTSISILLSPSTLQEPAFEELILLYTMDAGEKGDKNEDETRSSLQLEIFERIPIPDLPVIFPHRKLYFRIIDTVRLDIASILGLTAYFVNYKFENISSSPSAFFLDVIAVTALVIYATRVVLGYKQTWDRYQLLVNKTLYEKTLASGFGSVHFLLDASEQQQATPPYSSIYLYIKNLLLMFFLTRYLRNRCERFLYDNFKIKVEMRVEKAISTLVRLGLVTETLIDGKTKLQAVPCPQAYVSLKEIWNGLLG
ncbi:BnaC04g00550D [Brassica napus]|uniref:BnaC04g00550D protein n=1 Tax=Brassica napus TaxID=3708 RepID=A0A078HUS8_BRANA|nr:BnaC04g00550D [Brassica napus]